MTPTAARVELNECKQKLATVRQRRPRPHRDDKILVAWNGLMIGTYAYAYQVLGDVKYLRAAIRAADFIRTHMYNPSTQTLARSYRDGASKVHGFGDDYAFLTSGLIDLYEASLDLSFLQWANELQQKQNDLLWDTKHGGFYSTPPGDATLLFRTKDEYDGAEPCNNSHAIHALLRLGQMLNRTDYNQKAQQMVSVFENRLTQEPLVLPHFVAAMFQYLEPMRQIVLAAPLTTTTAPTPAADSQAPVLRLIREPQAHALLQAIHTPFVPNKVILFADGGAAQRHLSVCHPPVATMRPLQSQLTAFICRDFMCQLPSTDPSQVAAMMRL